MENNRHPQVPKVIIHVDMDAFYASVEQRDNPALRGKPVIVGGHAQRGVVLAASYEVRPYGVRSAMPMARAVKLAPQAVVVPPRFEAYVNASQQVFAIFGRYTPLIEPLSLDEAFLDVGGSLGLFGSPWDMARIRQEIAKEVGLPASAGISSVKFVAKIASDVAKPNGQKEVPPDETLTFLAPLPVSRLWGVGPKTENVLHQLGLHTVGDVASLTEAFLMEKLGDQGVHLWRLSHGLDDRSVVPDRQAKSIGAEDTFEHDLQTLELLRPRIHLQATRVARRLREAGMAARVVQLKLKTSRFKVTTRRTTLENSTDDGQVIFQAAEELLGHTQPVEAYRLTGVSVQDLQDGGAQIPLFDEKAKRSKRLNRALDAIEGKFGNLAVTTADISGDEDVPLVHRQGGASRLDSRTKPKR